MIHRPVVIDTNILMSALITPHGRIGRAIFNVARDFRLVACHYLYVEIFHHKEKILKANKMPENDFLELLLYVLNQIEFYNEQRISPENWQKATDLVHDIDPKDIAHIALTIHHDALIWTGDQPLKKGLIAKGFNNFFDASTYFS